MGKEEMSEEVELKKWAFEQAKSYEYSLSGDSSLEKALETAAKIYGFLKEIPAVECRSKPQD